MYIFIRSNDRFFVYFTHLSNLVIQLSTKLSNLFSLFEDNVEISFHASHLTVKLQEDDNNIYLAWYINNQEAYKRCTYSDASFLIITFIETKMISWDGHHLLKYCYHYTITLIIFPNALKINMFVWTYRICHLLLFVDTRDGPTKRPHI